MGIGVAVGTYGLSYGAMAVSAGLSAWQTQALSLLMYGGSSQLALVGVLASGGTGAAAAATACLLGIRNLFYGVSLAKLLRPRGAGVLPTAHLISDESTAMAIGGASPASARFAYWSTGTVVFLCWNLATFAGAMAGSLLTDPKSLGFDAASSAAFLALVAPRLRERGNQLVFLLSCVVAVGASTVTGSGLPVVLAAPAALMVLLIPAERSPRPDAKARVSGESSDGRKVNS
ncbi:AzlC family ABC transporter permease [Streptomyces hygroscopicus]|uniref:AzlC family ABC transporter permease n=1 Tax=Streptomyces hygroscopicus TaxID=1912 RepID=UPI002240A800|nr:AzlC family ABC transporter permease [Streptomyces hygroscopicus]